MEIIKAQYFGVIPVFKDSENNFSFCIIKHAEGHWGFPKGHQDANESEDQTAIRELKEETGIDQVNLDQKLFVEKYSFKVEDVQYDKSVTYFIGFVSSMNTTTLEDFKEEIPEIKWVSYEEGKEFLTFPQAKSLLDEAFNYLKSGSLT